VNERKRNLNGKLGRMSFQPIRYSAICHGTQCDDILLSVRHFSIRISFLFDCNWTDLRCANKVFLHTQQMWSKKIKGCPTKKENNSREKMPFREKYFLRTVKNLCFSLHNLYASTYFINLLYQTTTCQKPICSVMQFDEF